METLLMMIVYGAAFEQSDYEFILIMVDFPIRKPLRITFLIENSLNIPKIRKDPISKIVCPYDSLVILIS